MSYEKIFAIWITDASLSNYIQKVGDRVISAARDLDRQGFGPASHKKENSQWMFSGMQFHFVNSPTLNAFTTGGNHMYIYTGLFLGEAGSLAWGGGEEERGPRASWPCFPLAEIEGIEALQL